MSRGRNKLTVVGILAKLAPIAREVWKATRKSSDGGRKITPDERDAILAIAVGQVEDVLGEELRPFTANNDELVERG